MARSRSIVRSSRSTSLDTSAALGSSNTRISWRPSSARVICTICCSATDSSPISRSGAKSRPNCVCSTARQSRRMRFTSSGSSRASRDARPPSVGGCGKKSASATVNVAGSSRS
ncbi:ABC transporter, carbohydrate uptake transporter-2 (CUT2) family, ATP-binding domain protein [Burkholderia pseudomallei]|nr:ABC transporter, carbohydrate uptake transporter-2 (CUT2) family, ATP-binding domain protein [Burkholderia pseudomallei]